MYILQLWLCWVFIAFVILPLSRIIGKRRDKYSYNLKARLLFKDLQRDSAIQLRVSLCNNKHPQKLVVMISSTLVFSTQQKHPTKTSTAVPTYLVPKTLPTAQHLVETQGKLSKLAVRISPCRNGNYTQWKILRDQVFFPTSDHLWIIIPPTTTLHPTVCINPTSFHAQSRQP